MKERQRQAVLPVTGARVPLVFERNSGGTAVFYRPESFSQGVFLFETEAIVWSILPEKTAISSDPLQKRKLASNKKDWRIKNERIAENL